MKVRIGLGASVSSLAAFTPLLEGIGEFGFDSIWLPEVLTEPSLDPLIGLTWAAARYPRLKLGTTMLLPGRNVVRLAKQLATLDALSSGRLLVTFVPGVNRGAEGGAIGVPLAQRRPQIEEALAVLRELLAGRTVTHDGAVGSFSDVRIEPLPVQQPLEFWLGGMASRSLELCGRVADGWLPSLCTPDTAAAGRVVIERAAAEANRAIDPEHFGVSIGYSHVPLSGRAYERVAARAGSADLDRLVPIGLDALRGLIEDFIAAGFSKFVVRPMRPPQDWRGELEGLAGRLLDLQT